MVSCLRNGAGGNPRLGDIKVTAPLGDMDRRGLDKYCFTSGWWFPPSVLHAYAHAFRWARRVP